MPEKYWPFPDIPLADNRSDSLPQANEMLQLWLNSQASRLGFEEQIWSASLAAAENLLRRIPDSNCASSSGEICFTTSVDRMSGGIASKDVMPELSRYASALAHALGDAIRASGYSLTRCSGMAEATGAKTAKIRIEVEAGLIASL